jgi:large subunit ribosomal protein L9
MDVILLERVEKLGQMGDIVKVRPGYARNFLIPQAKALRATKHAKDAFEQRRAQLEAQNLERKREAEEMKARVDGRSVVLIRQASEMKQLYGSVSARDIAEAFSGDGDARSPAGAHRPSDQDARRLRRARRAAPRG